MASDTEAGRDPETTHYTIHPGALYSTNQAAARTGLSPKAFEAWRISGRGPAFCRLGRAVRYRGEDLLAWITANLRCSTSEG